MCGTVYGEIGLRNNHTDSYFDFSLRTSRRMSYSGARDKTDTTSAYARISQISTGKKMQTTLHHAISYRNVTQKNYYLGKGQSSYIYNSAYETYGYCRVRLGGRTQYPESQTIRVTGYWSPDSV